MMGPIVLTMAAAGFVAIVLPAYSLIAARRSAERVDRLRAEGEKLRQQS